MQIILVVGLSIKGMHIGVFDPNFPNCLFQIENALIYYLCLSTVDRRSHEKFIESSNQIGLLVEKFKLEGNPYRKANGAGTGGNSPIPPVGSVTPMHSLGRAGPIQKIAACIMYDLFLLKRNRYFLI